MIDRVDAVLLVVMIVLSLFSVSHALIGIVKQLGRIADGFEAETRREEAGK